jgi:hypothetical protein
LAYDVTLVQFNGVSLGLASTAALFPLKPCASLFHSAWYCAPTDAPRVGSSIGFGSQNVSFITVTSQYGAQPTCRVVLKPVAPSFYDATFALPLDVRWNVLVSVDCIAEIVQVYCNDLRCAQLSGGFKSHGNLLKESSFPINNLSIGSGNVCFPAIADLWEAAPPSFVDLSNVANRRRFINADLTPVDLGPQGKNPFAYQPPVFLTVPAASAPNAFASNYGYGGAFIISPGISLSFQAPGVCSLPPAPPAPGAGPSPPVFWTPQPGPYLREMTYRRRFIGKTYDPSVTVSKNRPGPLRIVEIDFWMSE